MKIIYVLSVKTLLVIFITTILFTGSNTFAKSSYLDSAITENSFSSYWENDIERKVLSLVNEERRKRNLRSLVPDKRLSNLARSHSRLMAKENFFSHYDLDGLTVVDRARDFKITGWRKIGENLFTCSGYDEPSKIAIRGWLKSTSHRKNMFKSDWTLTGIGVAISREGDIYITQVFLVP